MRFRVKLKSAISLNFAEFPLSLTLPPHAVSQQDTLPPIAIPVLLEHVVNEFEFLGIGLETVTVIQPQMDIAAIEALAQPRGEIER